MLIFRTRSKKCLRAIIKKNYWLANLKYADTHNAKVCH